MGILCTSLGYSDNVSSLFGVMFIVGAIFGAAIWGVIVEINKNYKKATTIICGFGGIAGMAVMYTLYIENLPLACISFIFTGAALSLLPVGIDFAIEVTYPVAETVSTGILMSSGNLIAFYSPK